MVLDVDFRVVLFNEEGFSNFYVKCVVIAIQNFKIVLNFVCRVKFVFIIIMCIDFAGLIFVLVPACGERICSIPNIGGITALLST